MPMVCNADAVQNNGGLDENAFAFVVADGLTVDEEASMHRVPQRGMQMIQEMVWIVPLQQAVCLFASLACWYPPAVHLRASCCRNAFSLFCFLIGQEVSELQALLMVDTKCQACRWIVAAVLEMTDLDLALDPILNLGSHPR
jgi:hypothetical protein